ncbi:MAG: hypothetical protein ACTHO8_00905 [Solirubrobacterales bacterium]
MPTKTDQQTELAAFAAAASHPLTVACYLRFTEGIHSPNELAREFGVNLSNLSYYVRKLPRLGAIEEVDSRPVRGATEHFYRAIERPVVTNAEFKRLSLEERLTISTSILQRLIAELTLSLQAGVFDARHDRVVIRHGSLDLDEEGWKDLGAAVIEMEERTYEIEAEVAERRAAGKSKGSIPATAAYLLFERAPAALPTASPDSHK